MKRRKAKKQSDQYLTLSKREKAILLLEEVKKMEKGKKAVRVDDKTIILIKKGENTRKRKEQFEKTLSDSRNRISY